MSISDTPNGKRRFWLILVAAIVIAGGAGLGL